ncbi:hypothetical protein FS837_008368, partial [Tulasnella sp. UAMH 9824]
MASFVASAAAPACSALFESTGRFYSQEVKTFSGLPEDVLLEVFTSLDFFEIIALRQTCRKCYRVSNLRALWLDAHRWITEGAEDWRVSLADHRSPPSADDLERTVTRLVKFERNWNRGSPVGGERTATFGSSGGRSSKLVPGGRWFLSPVMTGTRGVMSYDLDDPNIEGRMLIRQEHQDQVIGAMDLFSDNNFTGPEFDLAIISSYLQDLSGPTFTGPRNITIWKISLDESNRLTAKLTRSFPVFRFTPMGESISLDRDSLLRLSYTPSDKPVLTVHRWGSLGSENVTHSVLIPSQEETARSCVKLLPDGRIVNISYSSVEIYAPPDFPWEESPVIRQDIPRSSPIWAFEYNPPFNPDQHIVSRTLGAPAGDWVKFSIHSGETIFNFRIPLRTDLEPEVSSTMFAQIGETSGIVLGTSHTYTQNEKDAIFNTLDYLPRMQHLLAFAGVLETRHLPNPERLAKTLFLSSYPSTLSSWILDEISGRVLGPVAVSSRR